jgi:hypothetical protein
MSNYELLIPIISMLIEICLPSSVEAVPQICSGKRRPALTLQNSQVGAGTYGKVVDGFETTDSLVIPRRIGVFAASENMTSGALSVRERPFHPAKLKEAGVPTS